MAELPGDVTGFLRLAGWVPGRRAEIGAVVDALGVAGFPVLAEATAFLSEFGLLKFIHEPSVVISGARSWCWTRFDPIDVATTRDAETAGLCAAVAGTDLCPVGTDGFHLTIYISDRAEFFAGRDASVYRYADSCTALFRSMRDGHRPTLIGQWSTP